VNACSSGFARLAEESNTIQIKVTPARRMIATTELALSTLSICLTIHSHSNIADIARLYHSLRQSSFGASPLVTRLGVLLRVQK
jgi:hypothetical protein